MENCPLVSVIVPIYNVAAYLPRCLDSILAQTYTNLEIILVDDGSTDDCPQICDEYAAKDNRIRVIHQKNKGLPGARNTGIDNMQGEFFAFVDADDWIEKTCYQQLVEQQQQTQADMVSCAFYYATDTQKEKRLFPTMAKLGALTPTEFLLLILQQKNFSVWNKLFRRSWIGTARFDTRYTISEDRFFVFQLAKKGGRVAQVNTPLYFYYQRPQSMMRSGSSHAWYLAFKLAEDLYNRFQSTSSQPLQKELLDYLLAFDSAFCMAALLDEQTNTDNVAHARAILKKHRCQIPNVCAMGFGGKSFALCFVFFPRLVTFGCRLPGVKNWLKKSFAKHVAR